MVVVEVVDDEDEDEDEVIEVFDSEEEGTGD